MHKAAIYIILIAVLSAACANQDIDKYKYYEIGQNFLEKGNLNGAVNAFKKAIEKDRSYFEARYQLASAYALQNKYEFAEKELLKVLRLNPSMTEARLALARVYGKRNKINAALQEVDHYVMKRDDDPEAFEFAAVLYAGKKDYVKAEEEVLKSLTLSPARVSSIMLLAELYIKNKKTGQAEKLLRNVLDADPDNLKARKLLSSIEGER